MSEQILEATKSVFESFIDNYFNTVRLNGIAIRSIEQVSNQADLGQAIVDYKRVMGDEVDESIIEQTKEEAEFTKREVDKGFPISNSQSLVLIWGNFEAFVEDIVAICLENDPDLLKIETVQKIKIPLVQFEVMTSIERKYLILDILQRELQSKFKKGVSQFETILDTFGFGGPVDDNLRKNILEFSNIRNVLVHRRGIADRKLLEACPWLEINIGDSILINRSTFDRYSLSIVKYACIIYQRLLIHYGGSLQKIDQFLNSFKSV